MIDALAEAGIESDIVCGTSIGSLVGAAYVAGQLAPLRQWAMAATWREIVGLMDVRLSGGGLIDGKLIVAFLQGLGIRGQIESYSKKYAAVATDLSTGREIWLQSGPVHDAVRASLGEYLDFYDQRRPHLSLDHGKPDEASFRNREAVQTKPANAI